MSLSKERLNEIALEVACTLDLENPLCNVGITWINGFALALIRRVENELSFEYTPMHELLSQSNQLVTLPLVATVAAAAIKPVAEVVEELAEDIKDIVK